MSDTYYTDFISLEKVDSTGTIEQNGVWCSMSDKVSSILTTTWGSDWSNYRLARGVQVVYPVHKPEQLKWVPLSHLHEDLSVEDLFRDISLDPKIQKRDTI